MFYTLAAAAKASGLGVSAIRATIERGQITAIKDLFDEWQIEESELHRLYFPVGHAPANVHAGSGISPSAENKVERKIGARSGDPAQSPDANEDACPRAGKVHQDLAMQGGQLEQSQALSCSSSGNEGTGDQGGSPAPRQSLISFGEPGGKERHVHSGARPGLARLVHADEISADNTLFWDGEIKVDARHEPLETAIRPSGDRRHTVALAGALLMAFGIGWIGGFGSYHVFSRAPVQLSGDSAANRSPLPASATAAAAKDPQGATAGSVTGKIAPQDIAENKARRRYSQAPTPTPALESRQSKLASITRQNPAETASDNPDEVSALPRGNGLRMRMPFPETKPASVEGWTVRSVSNGTAVLEGPSGVWTAARGDIVPGLGRVDSIVLWGSRWIVATSRGLVTTP